MRTIVFAALFASAGCSAYDTDLGPTPFLCAAGEPRCPMEYTCVADPSIGKDVCVDGSENPANFDCDDDSAYEPNDTIPTATMTPLSNNTATLDSLAICPRGDKDLYKLTLGPNGGVDFTLTFDDNGAELDGVLLNANGIGIVSAAPVSGMTSTKRATSQNLPAASYFVQVTGPSAALLRVNNYQLVITVTP